MTEIMAPESSLRELAAQKEKEWKHIQELRTQSLENALREKERQLNEERARFQKLKEDFKYNLRLLGERDAELDKYDASFADVQTKLAAKEAEMSDLKIKIDELQALVKREQDAQEDLRRHYQHRLREKQAHVDQYRSTKDCELQQERQELEAYKRQHDHRLKELEEELDAQRREITTEFESILCKREHEFRKQADEMSATVLAHELKVKLLSKEIELVKASQHQSQSQVDDAEAHQRALEQQVKQKDWELQDMTAMKGAQITELETKIQQAEAAMNRQKLDFQRKHEQTDRLCKEKESTIQRLREAGVAMETEQQSQKRQLEEQVEQLQLSIRQLEWNRDDAEKEKNMQLERLQEELTDVRSRLDHQMSLVSQGSMRRDEELQNTKDNEERLKTELIQRKHDIERYQRELTAASQRESALERRAAQLDLDWQRRLQDLERNQYEHSEDLVKSLTKTRDEAQAGLRQCQRELQQRDDLIKVLTSDRDQALATLKSHGLLTDNLISTAELGNLPPSAADKVQELQQQNDNLRAVIHQMRQQMETLGGDLPASNKSQSVAEEYVKNLEKEVTEMKSKVRLLQQDRSRRGDADTSIQEDKLPEAAEDNVLIRSHVEALNATIGSLRKDKVELTAQVRKQQARIQHLDKTVNELSKQPKQKQIEVDQMKYELGAQQRRYEAEISTLKQRVKELDLQLLEARKEADEYYKSNIEKNMEVTSLENQLSALKMDVAQAAPTINFGAQELVIQQLQDEIQRLRGQQRGEGHIQNDITASQPITGLSASDHSAIGQLKTKLRAAATHIKQLAKEKQQLIEVNNKLRAELTRNGMIPSAPPGRKVQQAHGHGDSQGVGGAKTQSELSIKVQNKLSQLEQLQYELTRKELAVTKPNDKKTTIEKHPPARDEPSETSDSDHYRPPPSKTTGEPTAPRTAWSETKSPRRVPTHSARGPQPRKPLVSNTEPSTSVRGTESWGPLTSSHKDPSFIDPRAEVEGPATSSRDPHQARKTTQHQPVMFSLSSVGGESLQEIWNMLDDETISPRPRTPLTSRVMGDQVIPERLQSPQPTTSSSRPNDFMIHGSRPSLQQKGKQPAQPLPDKVRGKVTNKQTVKPKVRNYNVHDDNDAFR